ncbi:hypothetical protein G6F65_000632 [Rhizopus arrhizus]|nr:hypothetical protein G6F65_000632 [Rhizopus arrhizus]
MDFQKFIQNLDRKYTTVLTTAILTIAAAWFAKRAIKKSNEFTIPGLKDIPSPEGEYFYLGVQNWVFVGEPEVAHDIFTTKGSLTSGRPYVTYGYKFHGEGDRGIVFTDYGKSWKNTRTAALSILSPKSVDDLYHILDRETEFGVNLMLKDALAVQNKEGGIDPLAYTRLTAMNIILATVFGIQGSLSVQDPLYKRVLHNLEQNSAFISIGSDISAYFPVLSFLDVIFRKEKKMRDFVENDSKPLYRHLIQLARQSEQPSLVKELDSIKDSLNIDEQNMVALTRGVDTISLAMAWVFAILCHYPKWQKRMLDEVDLFIQNYGRLPLFTERQELPSMIAFIKETIRYRPSFLLGVPHKATEDIVYKDYLIPKGTLLIGSAHANNNDPHFFSEPEKFKPERYLNDAKSIYASSNGNVQNRELFTFGWGRRICPGIYMAESEMFNWMTRLFQKCTIEPALSSTGETNIPDIDDCIDFGSIVSPVPYKIHLL